MAAHEYEAAANEFRKMIDHHGLLGNCPLGVLAHLGLARSLAVMGQFSDSRLAYQNFFALLKDADSDVPVLRRAKREYSSLLDSSR